MTRIKITQIKYRSTQNVPEQLQGLIDLQQWKTIVESIQAAAQFGFYLSLVGCGICYPICEQSRMDAAIYQLNQQYFYGQSALHRESSECFEGDSLIIESDFIPRGSVKKIHAPLVDAGNGNRIHPAPMMMVIQQPIYQQPIIQYATVEAVLRSDPVSNSVSGGTDYPIAGPQINQPTYAPVSRESLKVQSSYPDEAQSESEHAPVYVSSIYVQPITAQPHLGVHNDNY